MNRREFMAAVVRAGAAAAAASRPFATPVPRTAMGIVSTSFSTGRRSGVEFLDYCHSLGASGVQMALGSLEPGALDALRGSAEELDMSLEFYADLPRDDDGRFEQFVAAAKRAGAACLRAACLEGRRYENFDSLEGWKNFVADSRARIERALPILEKHRIPVGIENHKDWTSEELARLMKDYSSEFLGVCLDTGNNIALLEDPMQVVERLAPYTVTTHVKDMAVESYPEGFLLAEVPLGTGMLDMGKIIGTIRKARPSAGLNLEMITRDPLKVPYVTERYWVTFPERKSLDTARVAWRLRSHKARRLRRVERLSYDARRRLEKKNVSLSLDFARQRLGLRGR